MTFLQASTWRLLGLNVAVGYAGLGIWEMLSPARAGPSQLLLGIEPPKDDNNKVSIKRPEGGQPGDTMDMVSALYMALVGARDVSIAAAISTFWYAGGKRREWEMGVVILSGTFLCLVDSAVVWMRRGPAL